MSKSVSLILCLFGLLLPLQVFSLPGSGGGSSGGPIEPTEGCIVKLSGRHKDPSLEILLPELSQNTLDVLWEEFGIRRVSELYEAQTNYSAILLLSGMVLPGEISIDPEEGELLLDLIAVKYPFTVEPDGDFYGGTAGDIYDLNQPPTKTKPLDSEGRIPDSRYYFSGPTGVIKAANAEGLVRQWRGDREEDTPFLTGPNGEPIEFEEITLPRHEQEIFDRLLNKILNDDRGSLGPLESGREHISPRPSRRWRESGSKKLKKTLKRVREASESHQMPDLDRISSSRGHMEPINHAHPMPSRNWRREGAEVILDVQIETSNDSSVKPGRPVVDESYKKKFKRTKTVDSQKPVQDL